MSGPWKLTVEQEYERCPQIKRSEVAMIRDWLSKQPHLPPMSENHIIVYLRACKFSLEKAKDVIDLHFTLRTRTPEFFSERRLNRISTMIKKMEVVMIPQKDNEGNAGICYRLLPMDLSEWNCAEFNKFCQMCQDVCNWEMGSAPGYEFIYDIKHLTFGQILHSPITQIAAGIKYAQDASACSIRSIQIMNGGTIFEKLFAVMKPFLNQEVIDVIVLHSAEKDVLTALGAPAVPKNYGGTAPSFAEGHEKMVQLLIKYEDAFISEENERVNEKLRPEGNKGGDFGIQGSFRKIEVD